MRLTIRHETSYRFDSPVKYGLQQLRKTPKPTYNQSVVQWRTSVTGGHQELSYEDHHGNTVELIGFARDAEELSLISEGVVDLSDSSGILGRHRGKTPLWLYLRNTDQTTPGSGVRALVRDVPKAPPLEQLHAMAGLIRDRVPYTLGASEPDWSAEDAITAGAGVCQDHTHIFISCARALGCPARYVSGYLMLDDRTVQDAMHAWAEAHVEGLGWVGFDVSNGISPDTRYVRVATGLDYAEAAPVSGMRVGGTSETLSVEIEVTQQ